MRMISWLTMLASSDESFPSAARKGEESRWWAVEDLNL